MSLFFRVPILDIWGPILWFSYSFWQKGGPEKRTGNVQKSRTRKVKETWKKILIAQKYRPINNPRFLPNQAIMSWSFSPSFIIIGWKLWIFTLMAYFLASKLFCLSVFIILCKKPSLSSTLLKRSGDNETFLLKCLSSKESEETVPACLTFTVLSLK